MKLEVKIINIYILYIFMMQISKKKMRKNYKSNKNKSKKRGTVLKGGSRRTNAEIGLTNPPSPRWSPCRNGSCSTVVTVPGLYLYGTSIPIWNQADMQNIFRFYLFRKDINRVISLHACGTPQGAAAARRECRPNTNLENTTFAVIKTESNLTNGNPDVEFIDLFIQDMTPGTLLSWELLTNYRFDTEREKTIIHCLAGFGRTGSALLFYIMYYKLNIFDILLKPFFNRGNSAGMYNFIRELMNQNILLDNNPAENDPWNGAPGIGVFNPAEVINETTKIYVPPRIAGSPSDVFHANLFISRINYCILFFASQHNVQHGTPIHLYQKLPINTVATPINIFRPVQGEYRPQAITQAVLNNNYVI
jgi:hypothetical protein